VNGFKKMDTLASSVDERVFKLLRNLVKLEEESSGGFWWRRWRRQLDSHKDSIESDFEPK
jgi:hypothetical protein